MTWQKAQEYIEMGLVVSNKEFFFDQKYFLKNGRLWISSRDNQEGMSGYKNLSEVYFDVLDEEALNGWFVVE